MRLQDKFGLDKCCHFFAGATIAYTVVVLVPCSPYPRTPYWPLVGFWAATLAGMVKEAFDKRHGEPVDWLDILATALGGFVPLAVELIKTFGVLF